MRLKRHDDQIERDPAAGASAAPSCGGSRAGSSRSSRLLALVGICVLLPIAAAGTSLAATGGIPPTGADDADDAPALSAGPALPDASPRTGSAKVKPPRHVFPIRGRATYGDGLGAGRGHQGQDLLARCGRRVVAARAGRVRLRDYHGAAGYSVTIEGRGNSREYVYHHLEQRGRPKPGSRVKTGEPIGFVGNSGNASTCHLHFELWTAPGSYIGGTTLDPAPRLRRWDR